jgi:Zn-dependent protease
MNTFYKIDSTRVSIREYWWENKSPLIVIAILLKWLRIRLPSSTDDPPTESLAPFQVPETSLPDEVRAAFQPMIFELANAGFHSAVFHAIPDPRHSTQIYFASFCHNTGQAVARIHYRIWHTGQSVRKRLHSTFVTEFTDGTVLVSTSGRPDLAAPPNHRVVRIRGISPSGLWAAHQRELSTELLRKAAVPLRGTDVAPFCERYHAQLRDFHLQRGVFSTLNEIEKQHAEMMAQTAQDASAAGWQHPEVLAELQRLQNKKVKWTTVVTVLLVSVLLFVAAGAKQWNWKTLLLILPVLFIHELGHYLAMLVFRYRNLRMFFIPFFGAAVTGQNYNVPGWKKAVVSLMGPVPGIFLGAILGVIGMITSQPLLIKAAIMLLIINGMNLLPVLPLDGGWVLHTILFSRHPVLDAAFRVLALGGLVLLAIFGRTRVLVYVAIPMVLGLPLAFKLAQITARLRERGVGAASSDSQTLPPETAQPIISEVKAAFPKMNPKLLAQHTLHVFETLNARPPGIAASLALLAVHGGSFVAAVIFGILFIVANQGDFGKFVRAAALQPEHKVACTGLQMAGGAKGNQGTSSQRTIVATFSAQPKAEAAFKEMRSRLTETVTVRLFGDSILVTLPNDDEAGRKKWLEEFSTQTTNTFVDSTNLHAGVTLMCLARTAEEAKALEQEAQEYFGAAYHMPLTPPWLPGDERSEIQRAQHRKARQTFTKLQATSGSYYKDSTWRATQTRLARAQQQGDNAEIKEIQAEQRDLMKQVVQKERERLRSEGPGKVDLELIDLYAALPEVTGTNYNVYRDALKGLAPRLGELKGDAAKRFMTRSGSVSRAGLLLTFSWLTFEQLGDGLPAFTEWLCTKGCRDLKYNFHQGFAGLENDDE